MNEALQSVFAFILSVVASTEGEANCLVFRKSFLVTFWLQKVTKDFVFK
jgi:hypothetical protein